MWYAVILDNADDAYRYSALQKNFAIVSIHKTINDNFQVFTVRIHEFFAPKPWQIFRASKDEYQLHDFLCEK